MAEDSRFESKAEARQWVWHRLIVAGVARPPLPSHGRIPNFEGAGRATERLLAVPPFGRARTLKVDPDSPLRHVRESALRLGIVLYMPSPRLRAGFLRFDPRRIPAPAFAEAAQLSTSRRWAEPVPLEKLPAMDAIVSGSVAVTRDGRRCGKGHGYGDIEYGILRELGHGPVPVATIVHPLQVVDEFPIDDTDMPVSLIVTPEETITIENPPPPPQGIDWDRLSEDDLNAMPILRELRNRRQGRQR